MERPAGWALLREGNAQERDLMPHSFLKRTGEYLLKQKRGRWDRQTVILGASRKKPSKEEKGTLRRKRKKA